MTRWLDPPQVDASPLAPLDLPPLLAQTLVRRGIPTPDSARAFLHPDATPTTPFPNIEEAVNIINLATRRRERICVWGDFDVDGQTSTALLVQTLRSLGADVIHYIPIRGKESHGVHIESLEPILDGGVRLIITCDTGVTAHAAIDYCNSRGVDVVVTDHHDLGETLPSAKEIVNPKLLPEEHPLRNLAGVGVAYKLAEALLGQRSKVESQRSKVEGQRSNVESQTSSEDLLDLVALGLIADVALLQGETRALAQKGIRALRNTQRLGLKVMAELAGTNLESLTEETIGFTFAPRLNALGRLSDANPAVELLITKDPARARVLAAQIEGLNAQRRLLTSQVYEAAEAQLRENPDLLHEPAIVLSHPNWPGGVVGIVANRLVDRYHKPAILLVESEDGILRGSARSVEGLHITEAIASQKDALLGFGGHPMAAGLSLQKDNLSSFRRGLGKAIEKQLGGIVREEPTLQIDAWLELNEINLELAEALEMLAPFGAGNPPLTFATRNVKIKSIGEIGRAKEHLRLNVEDEEGNVQSILWWNGEKDELSANESRVDIAYSMRASTFRGEKQVALQFEELRVVEEKPVEVRARELEIRDWRLESGKRSPGIVEGWKELDGVLIWAEGADKSRGRSRFELSRSDEFAIWTTPPSPADLRAALEIVKPKRVYVFGVSPAPERTDEFLARLAGMAKYAINNREGRVSVRELASALAQRESAVRIGLEWLAAGGHAAVSGENDALLLSRGNGEGNQYLQKELYVAVKGILEETAAYRAHFARADINNLMGSPSG
ncbi:single-stranded-DNA-specific exonuclease RecJ [Chloroflexi bacterium CFX2]|nr:single-stranded-DNA-specific exonuclease RecJ [Chloroflexi bacterium CFX2]